MGGLKVLRLKRSLGFQSFWVRVFQRRGPKTEGGGRCKNVLFGREEGRGQKPEPEQTQFGPKIAPKKKFPAVLGGFRGWFGQIKFGRIWFAQWLVRPQMASAVCWQHIFVFVPNGGNPIKFSCVGPHEIVALVARVRAEMRLRCLGPSVLLGSKYNFGAFTKNCDDTMLSFR